MKAEFKGLVDLNAFEFVDGVPDGVNVVSARWVFFLEGGQRWQCGEAKRETSRKRI